MQTKQKFAVRAENPSQYLMQCLLISGAMIERNERELICIFLLSLQLNLVDNVRQWSFAGQQAMILSKKTCIGTIICI